MSKNTMSLVAIADHVTPKIDEGGVTFSLRSRDYKDPQCVCLNDQGGSVMNITDNVSGTLRAQMRGHPPVVLENHPNDSRVKLREDGTFQTLSSRMGTGGAMCRWLWRTIWKNTLCVGLRR